MAYESPVPDNPVKISPNDDRHRGLCGRLMEIPGESRQLLIFRDASEHFATKSAVTKAVKVKDWGTEMFETSDSYEIYSDSNHDCRDHGARNLDDGRLGVVFWEQDVDGSGTDKIMFIYSDDGGDTWSSVDTGLPGGVVKYIHRYPSEVGGADTGGWIIYCESDSNTGNDLNYAYTTDNGDSWTTGTALSSPDSAVTMREPTVARIGSENKWLLMVRDSSSGTGTTAWIAKSTDMTSWTAYDTGVELGSNPPYIHYFNGNLWWLAPSRSYSRGREIENFGDQFLHQTRDAQNVWDSPGSNWPGWESFSNFEKGHLGYSDLQVIDGRMVLITAVNEAEDSSSVQLAVYTGEKVSDKIVEYDGSLDSKSRGVLNTR